MTDWLTSISNNSINAEFANVYEGPLANDWTHTAEYQAAIQNMSSAPNGILYMEDQMNAWMWKNHPLDAFFKVNVWGKPIIVTSKQALIGGGAGVFLLFLMSR